MAIEIKQVDTPARLRDFHDVKRQLYRDQPNATRPLKSMAELLVDSERHPFYQHASRELFVAYRDGQPMGRVAAIVDTLQQQHDQNRMGFFGFFECPDDPTIAAPMLDVAADWLRSQGCTQIRGPVEPSMKGEFGVMVEGEDSASMVMTAYNFPYYKRLIERVGFEVCRTFHAYRFQSSTVNDFTEKWNHVFQMRDRVMQRYPQLSFRAVTAATFDRTMKDINELGNRVRAEGWGFVPLTEAELDFMINNLRRVIRYDTIHVAYWEDRLVGYIVNIPDVNSALARTWGAWDWLRMLQMPFLLPRVKRTRVIALGVDQDYRTKGIAMILIARLLDLYDQFDEWEFSWVDSENTKSLRAIGRALPMDKFKTYELYQRSLD